MVRVLFECHHLYYLPQFIPIIKELQQRENYSLYASISSSSDRNEQRDFRRAVTDLDMKFITDRNDRRRTARLNSQNFGLIFIGNVGYIKRIATKRSLVVMVYHGIGLKQSYYNDMIDRVDLRAVESKERYRFLADQGEKNLVLSGFTKLDPLAGSDQITVPDYISKANLNPDRKTILYAPTFYPSSFNQLLPALPALSEEFNIILKLHSFSWYHRRYRHQGEQANQMFKDNPRVVIAPSHAVDILPLYQISDLMVSDLSSTLFEYLVIDKPVIQTEFHSLRWKHRKFPKLIEKRLDRARADSIDFTYRLNTPDNLAALIRQIEKTDNLKTQRQAACTRYLHNLDGQATIRLVDAVEARLKS